MREDNSFFPLGSSCVDPLRMMSIHLLDQTLLNQFLKSQSSKRCSDLQPFRDDRRSDEFVTWYFFVQFLVCWFVEQNQIVQLVASFSFRPLLLLRLTSTSSWFRFLRFRCFRVCLFFRTHFVGWS